MFEDIKQRLGSLTKGRRGSQESYDDYYDEEYDDYEDDYVDYGGGYEEDHRYESDRRYESGSSGYGSDRDFEEDDGYSSYGAVTTRPASSRGVRSPRLVSIDDVRAHTQIPESLNRDPLPPRQVTSPYSTPRSSSGASSASGGYAAQAAADFSRAMESDMAAGAASRRSEGLESLFTPTVAESPAATSISESSRIDLGYTERRVGTTASASNSASSYDPYDAYAGTSSARYSGSRKLEVIRPSTYSEVERVAKALKAGDVVVLGLRSTPDSLAKRILDFSFGVAAALDASVDCVADKIFVISRGAGLSDAERLTLRSQGLL